MLAVDMAIRYRWKGERLRKFREAAGLTETELAAQVGVTAQAIQKWERGAPPKLLAYAALCKALHVEFAELIERDL